MFRVKNLKDPIKDLSITPDDNLRKDVVIQPFINHASLGKDESIVFSVSPIWSKDVGSIGGFLTASAGTMKKDLHVDFSCEKGRQLYEIILPRPLLHFDINVYQCINAYPPIEGTFLLPPGLTADDVAYAKIGMDLDARDGLQTPYDVWATINGNEVGRISKDVFSIDNEFDINPIYLSYTTAGSAINRYSINDTMPRQYRTYISNVKVLMCLKELRLNICAENQQQAEEIAWRIPWIYNPSNKLNVSILEPKQGEHLIFGTPTTIKAKVEGNSGGEKYSFVRAKSNNSAQVWRLGNNGQYDAGVYATTWTPDAIGASSITVIASNCATIGSYNISVIVERPRPPGPDLIIFPPYYVGVIKSYDPIVLDVSKMDEELGNVIKYTIKVVPIGGIKLKDVKVIENLPNYIMLNNSSVKDRGSIRLNHDGKEWSTTNITWNIGDLDMPRSLAFEGVFHWRLPADAQHVEGSHLPESVVTYSDYNGGRYKQEIPEGEIKIGSSHLQKTETYATSKKGPNGMPGFEALIALISILAIALIVRKS
jgi:PGF-CTERM protein